MNTETSSTRPPLVPILILLGGFSLLLFFLLVSNITPTTRITPQNVHLLHETLRLEGGLRSNGNPPNGFALSSDNTTLLVTSGYINDVWRLKDGNKQTMNLLDAGGATALVFFDGEQPLATFANWTNSISFLNLNNGQTIQRFDGITANILYGDWNISPDHHWFVVTRNESVLSLSDMKTGEVRFSTNAPPDFLFRHINPTFSPDGTLLATSLIRENPFGFDTFLWDAVTGKLVKHLGAFEAGMVDSFTFSHDGKLLAVGGISSGDSSTSIIQLWDLEDGEKLTTWYGGGLSVQRLFFTPDDQTLVASGYGDVWLWDIPNALKTGTPYLHLQDSGHGTDYASMALSHDGVIMAVNSPKNDILIYKVKTGAVIGKLSGHQNRINQLAFSDDDQFLISSSDDYTVRFWSVSTSNSYPKLTNPPTDVAVPAPIMTPTVPG